MTPLERCCWYTIGILLTIITTSRAVETWIDHLENRYWQKKAHPEDTGPVAWNRSVVGPGPRR